MAVEEIHAEMVSSVWKVLVEAGAQVAAGDTLVILESMKMEIPVLTETAGTVQEMHVVEGEVLQEGDLIATVAARAESPALPAARTHMTSWAARVSLKAASGTQRGAGQARTWPPGPGGQRSRLRAHPVVALQAAQHEAVHACPSSASSSMCAIRLRR